MTQSTLPTRGKSGRFLVARELENDEPPISPTQFSSIARTSSLPFPISTMSHYIPTGLGAMPAAKSQRAPRFSDKNGEILSEFLRDYEHLADGNGLTEKQKVETILRYVPRSVRNFWSALPGYAPANWHHFRAEIESFYPDIAARTRCTRQVLTEFLELSAESLIHDENDIMKYYRSFLTIALPLLQDNKISDNDFNAEFFKGFHADDQDILADQLLKMNPRHPESKPFEVEDVVSAARWYFANDRFHKPLQLRVRSELRGRPKSRRRDSEKFVQRLFGDDRPSKQLVRDNNSPDSEPEQDDAPADLESPTYETCNGRFKESGSAKTQQPGDEDDPVALVTKLKSLSVHEPSYLVLYSHFQERFPNTVQHLPKPDLLATQSSTATVAYQGPSVPAPQPWAQRTPAPPNSNSIAAASNIDVFLYDRNGARSRSCIFCGTLGHRIRGCPMAKEYVDTGRAKIIGNRLHLPTGQPILNDGRGLGLKASIDTWLAANAQYSSEAVIPATRRDPPPPHATSYGFKILSEPATPAGAYITEETNSDTGDDDGTYTTELYEVIATGKKGSRRSKDSGPAPPVLPTSPPASIVPSAPLTSTSHTPQYRYQTSAEDQALTKELLGWILEGKLDMATPAHILAACPVVRKELVERLKPARITQKR